MYRCNSYKITYNLHLIYIYIPSHSLCFRLEMIETFRFISACASNSKLVFSDV